MKDINHQNLTLIECSQSLYVAEGAKGKNTNMHLAKMGRRKGKYAVGNVLIIVASLDYVTRTFGPLKMRM